MKCTNDIGKTFHVGVTLVAIKNDNNEKSHLIFQWKIWTQENNKKCLQKNAKRRSEKIIQHLLPPLAYESVMKGDQDSTSLFVSNSATVISVQIVGILDCVNSLSPSH